MGTSYRSKKFHDVCWKNIGDAGFPDRILWHQSGGCEVSRSHGHEPRGHLRRFSAGGQNALRALLAHGDFYKAGGG